jgi:hypothetical protein
MVKVLDRVKWEVAKRNKCCYTQKRQMWTSQDTILDQMKWSSTTHGLKGLSLFSFCPTLSKERSQMCFFVVIRSRLVWKILVCISVKSWAGLKSIFLVPNLHLLCTAHLQQLHFFPICNFVVLSEGRCFSTIYPVVVCTKVGKLPMHAWLSTFRPWNKGFQESSLLKEI